MQSQLRELIGQLDIAQMVASSRKATRLTEEVLQDAILGVLAALLHREAEYAEKFPTRHHLYAYVKKSALREAVRVHQKRQRHTDLDEFGSPLVARGDTPESQLLAKEARTTASHRLSQLEELATKGLQKMGRSPQMIAHSQRLIELLRSHPELFLLTRQSGAHKGALVIDQARLAEALGWDKRRVSERLRALQQALQLEGWEVS